ncbi:hypothetical protein PFICI_10740 [Pestalotiopsis fici W106-1]|uniref:Uncharacterized protein n=1 Tax=Pestalotiopsis fici (strain W106-1 / CGMCC3.15140) TaxID=1229662 RepID=W3WVK0_PESFW|nr:uncharacterized protein PFICI_10740 [Pestalotiopsis fici W106-1]ETS76866.1 hypothetical protein PFICI_10740 [Pestalotiopsis fici W106-1]
MSSTPRRKRHHQQNNSANHAHPPSQAHQRTRSQHLAAQAAVSANQITSDYESDTASYMAAHAALPNPALAQRSNDEINITVLRRYIPSLTQIYSIASNAVVYAYDSTSDVAGFEKANIEGPLFTCQLNSSEVQNSVFILNRKSTDNLRLDLATVTNFEQSGDMLYIETMGSNGEPKVWGLYIHDSSDNRRETHTSAILRLWHATKEALVLQAQMMQQSLQQGGGRQININDLLKR